MNQARQSVRVGGFQLGELAIFENFLRQIVGQRQLFQNFGGGRPAFRDAAAARRLQVEPVEKHFGKLLRRIDLELETREFVNAFFQTRDFFLSFGGDDVQFFFVHANAGAFHARQHRGQREVDAVVETRQAQLFHFRAQHGGESAAKNRRARRARRKACDSSGAKPPRRKRDWPW